MPPLVALGLENPRIAENALTSFMQGSEMGQQTARRNRLMDIGGQAASGDLAGARQSALREGEYEVANQLGEMSEEQREIARSHTDTLGRLLVAVRRAAPEEKGAAYAWALGQAQRILPPEALANVPRTQDPVEIDRFADSTIAQIADLEDLLGGGSSDQPSAVREWLFFNGLDPDAQQQFLALKRNPQFLNLGDQYARPDPLNPGRNLDARSVGLKPERDIQDDRVLTLPGVPGGAVSGETGEPGAGGFGTTQLPPSRAQQSAALSAINELESQHEVVLQDIDRAITAARHGGFGLVGTTGLSGSVMSNVPGTDAHDLSQTLNTIKANIGFDKLQAMREASPTGGALGQVSERENTLLQSVMGALNQSQSEAQFVDNLTRLKTIIEGRREERRRAFQRDFGGGGRTEATTPELDDAALIRKYVGGQ